MDIDQIITLGNYGILSDLYYRYLNPSGFRSLLVRNSGDLEMLLTNNRNFCGELAHNLSARKRTDLIRRAAELNVKLTNGKGKVRTEEKKGEG